VSIESNDTLPGTDLISASTESSPGVVVRDVDGDQGAEPAGDVDG
jgi:hypothetical protein